MLSVCIPVFNYHISPLIDELLQQLENIKAPFEIIVIDDASDKKYRKQYEDLSLKTTFVQLDENIGRAKIRNKFLEIAQYDYLLFIDNDSRMFAENYIQHYLTAISQNQMQIIFGGRVFGKRPSSRDKLLRWKYGIKRESKSADIRNLSPNKSFMTNNFIIHRSLFKQVKFDENLVEYGHEDTLFGYELKKRGVCIKHIENPVLNGDYETNDHYLIKTEKAILNLISMLKNAKDNPDFVKDVKLLAFNQKLQSLKIAWLVRWVFILKRPFIRYLLSRGYANMYLFSFYKLGFLMMHYKR